MNLNPRTLKSLFTKTSSYDCPLEHCIIRSLEAAAFTFKLSINIKNAVEKTYFLIRKTCHGNNYKDCIRLESITVFIRSKLHTADIRLVSS